MKKTLLLLVFAATSLAVLAQEKVKQLVTDDYDRNGLSVVVLNRGDKWDQYINEFITNLIVDEKFDVNDIATKTINARVDRSEALTQGFVDTLLINSGISREILGFVFNRKSDGSMDDALLRSRGLYNAKDQDILNASAAKVQEQYLEWGEKLLNGGYIALLDVSNLKENVTQKKDGSTSVNYDADVKAYVYKLACDRAKLDDFYSVAWADATSSAAAKAAARKAFDQFEMGYFPVATVSGSNSSTSSMLSSVKSIIASGSNPDTTPLGAIQLAYNNVMSKLENTIPAWQVAVSIVETHPLRAKIGMKEGLKNGQRFRAYSYAEDKDGNLVSEKRGYLRATKVFDNRSVATGSTEPSEFYQISGVANIQEGWTIKQKNDLRLGVGLSPGLGLSAFQINLDLDYLVRISQMGSIYALVSLGTDPTACDFSNGVFDIIFGVGAGYGLHLTRMFELAPYAKVGVDALAVSDDTPGYYKGSGTSAFFVEPGARFSVNFYPLSVYLKVYYDYLMGANSGFYGVWNNSSKMNHASGIGAGLGVKWTF